MKLNPRLRLDFDGDINASRASLDFTELQLAALNLDNNAAATEVRVGTLSDEVDIRADNNAAKLTLSLPRDFGCEAKIQSAVSKHNAHELMPRRVGDRWFSEGFADSPRKVRLHIEANASKVDFTTD